MSKKLVMNGGERDTMSEREALIKQMVDRFLGWRLPKDFMPDGGVKYINTGSMPPVGTNLFTAVQAKQMVEYLLGGALDQYGNQREQQGRIDELKNLRKLTLEKGSFNLEARIEELSDLKATCSLSRATSD